AREEGLAGGIGYSTDLFEADTIARLAEHYRVLLEAAAAGPGRRLSELPLLGEGERRQLLVEWSAGGAPHAAGCVNELFERQVERTPGAVALVHGEERLSYAELDRRANRLAHALRARGVGPEARVGILLERGTELVVALLAVLKAGGAYVPLDPAYPPERVAYMLRDSAARVLVTRAALRAADSADLPGGAPRVVLVDEERAAIAREPDHAPPGSGVTPQNLAYVIYTSGSTGAPKGVMLQHGGASVLLHGMRGIVPEEERASVLASTSATFDVSVAEIFGTLCWGGKLVLVENALELAGVPAGEEVRLGVMVPAAAAELLRTGAIPGSVRALNLAGEALPAELAAGLHAHGVRTLRNLYGPTEDTVYSTWTVVEPGAERVTIGRPLPGSRAYVLDAYGSPAPVGVPGELHLAGAGVARGYLGRAELTAAKFVPDPFAAEPGGGARMYRTGDRVRWLAKGEIEYLGRIDQQVKVRGFRIEPGEIEAVLRTHGEVREAVVVVREDAPGAGGPGLVAYLVPAPGHDPGAAELRRHLRARLPEYMVPAAFVRVERIPLSGSGKVDRRALPAPGPGGTGQEGYVAPRTPEERTLAGIWAEVLGAGRVGVHDSFFDLGGHSLLLPRVQGRVSEAFRVELSMLDLFRYPTVGALAEHLRGAGAEPADVDPSLQRLAAGRARLRRRHAQHQGVDG
ncbi:MAG: amino acid adenylation domain-containing protein, partial [Longimicrobiaceae bacterium]